MSTITNNKLPDERVSNATLIRLIQWADQHNSHYVAAALCELQERRKADSAEPAGYHVIKECGKVGCSVATLEEAEKTRDFWNKKWIIKPYFYAPPVQETGVYKDMLNIINLLENNEWAEHCTGTVLGSLLESEITRLVSKEQPAPVVPDDGRAEFEAWMLKKWGRERQEYDFAMSKFLHGENYADSYTRHMWKAWTESRAAMLQSKYRDLSQPVDPQISEYERIMLQAGNSPVIPDGYTLVPVEPTDEMIAAAMNCEDVLFNSDESFCIQFGNIYEAMLAAAPQQEVK
ncbi:hypothetical protein DKG50_16695 [Salmonella enterica]|nr:hypothetical protein [Salmonella enterica]